jgi:hypothetical protein
MRGLHICRFSSLDELKPRDRGDHAAVLRVLEKAGRFSVFEATEHQKLGAVLTQLPKDGLAIYDHSCGFPWTKVTLTDKGRELAFGRRPADQP